MMQAKYRNENIACVKISDKLVFGNCRCSFTLKIFSLNSSNINYTVITKSSLKNNEYTLWQSVTSFI